MGRGTEEVVGQKYDPADAPQFMPDGLGGTIHVAAAIQALSLRIDGLQQQLDAWKEATCTQHSERQ